MHAETSEASEASQQSSNQQTSNNPDKAVFCVLSKVAFAAYESEENFKEDRAEAELVIPLIDVVRV